jgi:hypothetical protein
VSTEIAKVIARGLRGNMEAVQAIYFPSSKLFERAEHDERLYGARAYICGLYEVRQIPAKGLARLFGRTVERKFFFVKAVLVHSKQRELQMEVCSEIGEDDCRKVMEILQAA